MALIIDISVPISAHSWAYKEEWKNQISTIASIANGHASTVYRFNLCSHTGSYIETSQHKLPTQILLEHFPLSSFIRPCLVLCHPCTYANAKIARKDIEHKIARHAIRENDALIIATGWGNRVNNPDYIKASPYFDEELTCYLSSLNLGLFGTDLPVIDCQRTPYGAINRLFKSTPQLLVLAPLVVDTTTVASGRYTLVALPLKIEGVCASLCRPILLENLQSNH